MKDIYVNDQISLAEGKFVDDKNIDKAVFGPNVSYIPENCFNGCNNLKEVVFEGNINNIEAAAFMNCNNLQTINANTIGIIEDFAFYGCNNIINFNINEDIVNNIKYGTNNDSLSTYFVLPEIGTSLNDISWHKIDLISRKGKAKNYFKVGDEKKLIIEEFSYYDWENSKKFKITHPKTTYHIQILGFNHDNKSDNSGKTGITFGLKEPMSVIKVMNFTNTNVGGWKDSKMRNYLQYAVYNALPSKLQSVIKTVNKISDTGNKDTSTLVTTQDKLFLFSMEEVGFTEYNSLNFVSGQGTKYEYFADNISRTKDDYWWLRSTNTNNEYRFHCVMDNGISNSCDADFAIAIVFGFCI